MLYLGIDSELAAEWPKQASARHSNFKRVLYFIYGLIATCNSYLGAEEDHGRGTNEESRQCLWISNFFGLRSHYQEGWTAPWLS